MKRILILGDAGSSHLTKWILALHGKYFEIAVFSLSIPAKELDNVSNLRIFIHHVNRKRFSSSLLSKFAYLSALPQLKKFAADFSPHIIHAHYASSYGLLGSLLGRHPYIISAWGSDVYDFGNSALGRMILRFNFRRAEIILSTSEVMKLRIQEFTRKEIKVTPFGVDTTAFLPGKLEPDFFPTGSFIFGMIKSMEDIYGVDLLIRTFKKLTEESGSNEMRLLLVGGGTQMSDYEQLCIQLGIRELVHFTGRVVYVEVPKYHQMMDVFLNPSRRESFGVSVLEAMSCGKAVIVSDVGGLAEIVEDGNNGLLVQLENVDELKNKMILLYENSILRNALGVAAREFVLEKYNWQSSVNIMLKKVYDTEWMRTQTDL